MLLGLNLVSLGPSETLDCDSETMNFATAQGLGSGVGQKSVSLRLNLVSLRLNLVFLRPKLVSLRPNLVLLRLNLAFLGPPETLDLVSEALILVTAQGSGVGQHQCF